ncbi:MAG: ABC transporter permease [Verrucomicrobiota bacterium]|nr:ABC transporter permease [Verrucomicrobiota bacterium]
MTMRARHVRLWLGELRESVFMSLHAIAVHKLRSTLTLLGVLIGVFSIIVVSTAMRVLEQNVERNLSQLGGSTFAVQKFPPVQFGNRRDWEKYWRRKDITLEQGKVVEEKATLAGAVGVEGRFWSGRVRTIYAKTGPAVALFGETPGSFAAHGWEIADGRILTTPDLDERAAVCVLGAALAKTIFPFGSAVGQPVKLNGIPYNVVGVLAPQGKSLGGLGDNFALIPLTTGLGRYGLRWSGLSILVEARSAIGYADCMEQVRDVLRGVRHVLPGQADDFEIFSNDTLIGQFKSFTLAVRIGVAVVSSLALLAAGVGIMNIMLVSVTERTREIGVRRAIGARKRNIAVQFIIEAIVLCEIGGAFGTLLGVAGGNILAWRMKLPPALPLGGIVLAVILCSVVGTIFGTYPALKAANLDPIESLRYE